MLEKRRGIKNGGVSARYLDGDVLEAKVSREVPIVSAFGRRVWLVVDQGGMDKNGANGVSRPS